MKKTIFGSTLMICGVIALCTEYLKHEIFFASPDIAVIGENYLLSWGGRIAFVIVLVLCVVSLFTNHNE